MGDRLPRMINASGIYSAAAAAGRPDVSGSGRWRESRKYLNAEINYQSRCTGAGLNLYTCYTKLNLVSNLYDQNLSNMHIVLILWDAPAHLVSGRASTRISEWVLVNGTE